MSKGRNIAIGGFQHETNTFAPYTAPFGEFVKTDGWPGLTVGEALYSVMEGLNIPIAGFIEASRKDQHRLLPILWCSAEPSSYVTDDAFERVAQMLCEALENAEELDAVYLDLHGAMVVESLGDGNFTFTGDMYKDSAAQLGPMALLRVVDDESDVRVIVGSSRVQCLDQAIFRHLGVEPAEQKILAVKSSVHFRADFDPIAAETLVVVAPGVHPCQLADLPYRHLRADVRLEPMGLTCSARSDLE